MAVSDSSISAASHWPAAAALRSGRSPERWTGDAVPPLFDFVQTLLFMFQMEDMEGSMR